MREKAAVLETVMLLLGILILAIPCPAQVATEKPGAFGKAAVTGDAEQMSATIVTAVPTEPLSPKKNVLWCATLQVAWDELACKLGKTIEMKDAPPTVAALNSHFVARSDLDPNSFVAFAGRNTATNKAKVRKEMMVKFHGTAVPRLLDSLDEKHYLFMYAYLLKSLPFAIPFQRSNLPFLFDNTPVASWNCFYNYEGPTKQVTVSDYKNPDDFVLTVATASTEDVLVLAKVPPASTLMETTEAVERRIKDTGDHPSGSDHLVVPVLDFDLFKRYKELCGHHLLLGGHETDLLFDFVNQIIRFKLDETGAYLESEVEGGVLGGELEMTPPPRSFVFDKPFLVMIKRKNSMRPYFALWVANAELMVPMHEVDGVEGHDGYRTMNDRAAAILRQYNEAVENYRKFKGKPKIYPMGTTRPPKLLKKVAPKYPSAALAAKIGGQVVLELTINEKGDVTNARILKSTASVFNDSALEAVKQYKYSAPTSERGESVSVYWIVTIDYKP
jgi:TonB family protein